MRLTLHLVQLLAFVLIVGGPLPLLLFALVRTETPGVESGWTERLLAVWTSWCCAQAVLALLLGLSGRFTAPAIVVAELALFIAGGVALARRGGGDGPRMLRPPALVGSERLVALALVVVGLTLLWWSAAVPVADYDSWSFHMPAMAQWLQTGTLGRFEPFVSRLQGAYPYTWEALCALLLAGFGEDMLLTSPNLIAWALLGLATYQLGRHFGARRVHALASAALLLVLPGIIVPVNSMHVDLPFAAMFAVCASSVVTWQRTGARRPRLLAILAAGLLAGIRVTAFLYFVVLLIVIAVHRVTSRAHTVSRPPFALPEIACSAVALFVAFFWYVKNLVELGNPLGVHAVQLGSLTIFPGARPLGEMAADTLAVSFVPWRPAAWALLADRAAGELGLPFIVLVLLAGAGVAAAAARRAPRLRDAAVLWTLLVGSVAVFWITPTSGQSGIQLRLGFPCLAMLAVVAACGATALQLRGEVAAAAVLISATLVIAQSKVLAPVVAGCIAWDLWTRVAPRQRGLIEAAALAAGVAAATFVARDRRDRERMRIYDPYYAFLEQQVGPRASVAYLCTPNAYLLYGRDLQRRLRYAPFTAEGPAEWLSALRDSGVDAVAVGAGGDASLIEQARRLLDSADSGFVRVYGAAPGEMAIYRRRESKDVRGSGS